MDAISASEAAIASEPMKAMRVPHTNDVYNGQLTRKVRSFPEYSPDHRLADLLEMRQRPTPMTPADWH